MSAYEWKSGYRAKVAAEVAHSVFEGLEAQNRLCASEVVNDSRPENAPLHPAFEWDDKIAGEEWRKEQARCMIRSIIVRPEEKDGEKNSVPMRCFYHIQTAENRNYESLEVIVKNEDKKQKLLQQAWADLTAFRVKYISLKEELHSIFDLIEKHTAD